MPLNEILNPDIIDLEVQGETKDEVLRYMAGVLLKNGYINDCERHRRTGSGRAYRNGVRNFNPAR